MNIENRRQFIFIAAGAAAGLLAVVGTSNYITGKEKQTAAMMRQQIEALNKQNNEKINQVAQQIHAQVLADSEKKLQMEMAKYKSQMDQVVASMPRGGSAPSGQPVPAVPQESLALKTPKGKRAITVQIDELSAVNGMISPGDYVDIMAHLNVPEESAADNKEAKKIEPVTTMVFQDVQVLAVNHQISSDSMAYDQHLPANAKTPQPIRITFALDPQEAGLLSFAEANGTLQLALRSPRERKTPLLQVSDWQTLSKYILEKQGTDITAPRKKAAIQPAAEEVKPFIQVFSGGRERKL